MMKESPSIDFSSSRFLFRDADAEDTIVMPGAARASPHSGVGDVMGVNRELYIRVCEGIETYSLTGSLCPFVWGFASRSTRNDNPDPIARHANYM